MPTPEKCPSCGTKVPPYAKDCPGCPMSFQEEEGVLDYRQRKGKDYSGILLVLAAVLLFGVLAFKALNKVMEMGAQDMKQNPGAAVLSQQERVGAAGNAVGTYRIDDAQKVVANLAAGGTGTAPLPSGAHAPHKGDGPGVVVQEEPPQGGEEIVIEQAAPVAPARKRRRRGGSDGGAAGQWRLRGRLYDLVTLEPMTGVTIHLKDIELERRVETVTDQDGRYAVTLPPLSGRGYAVVFDYPGYSPMGVADSGTTPVRQQSKGERAQLARELSRTVTAPQSIEGRDDGPVITDFYLAPKGD